MVSLFVSDIDGCLAEPYEAFALEGFGELTRRVRAAGTTGSPTGDPPFSICTGRPYPYVEAMTQLLGIQMPVLFEAGAGLFDPVKARVHWHPALTQERMNTLDEVRTWFLADILPGTRLMYDHAKRAQVGIIGPDPDHIAALVPEVEAFVADVALDVYHTPVSIDVTPHGINKAVGLRWLSEWTSCPLKQMAYIGDTNGDLEALELVGHSYAPANAVEEVRASVRTPMRGRVLEAVLEAYSHARTMNHANHTRTS